MFFKLETGYRAAFVCSQKEAVRLNKTVKIDGIANLNRHSDSYVVVIKTLNRDYQIASYERAVTAVASAENGREAGEIIEGINSLHRQVFTKKDEVGDCFYLKALRKVSSATVTEWYDRKRELLQG